jgi:hypothetical protein
MERDGAVQHYPVVGLLQQVQGIANHLHRFKGKHFAVNAVAEEEMVAVFY